MVKRSFLAALLLIGSFDRLVAEEPEPTENVIRLTVDPMAAPTPALKYYLLPPLVEMHSGNAIQGYYKVWSPETWSWTRRGDLGEKLYQWIKLPFDEVPFEEINWLPDSSAMRMLDVAARCETVDWDMRRAIEEGGFGTLLPDVQAFRETTHWLGLCLLLQAKERDYDGAIRTAQTMFAMGRHLDEHPTLIGNLVGSASMSITIERLEELIQQPGCPNLYWALTNLPQPMVGFRKGLEGEVLLVQVEVGAMTNPEHVWTPEEEKRHLARLNEVLPMAQVGDKEQANVAEWLQTRQADGQSVPAARQRLRESGIPADRLGQMSDTQVLLLDDFQQARIVQDELLKLMPLPYWEAGPRFEQVWKQVGVGEGSDNILRKTSWEDSIFMNLVASLDNIRRVQARLEQRFGLLRHVEAVRLYAAAHEGKLPESLDEIEVPLPVDPVTGKPFLYAVEDGKAIIRGTPPEGTEGSASYNVRVELTLRK